MPPMGAARRSGELDPALANRNPEAAGFDDSSNHGVSGTNFSDEPLFHPCPVEPHRAPRRQCWPWNPFRLTSGVEHECSGKKPARDCLGT